MIKRLVEFIINLFNFSKSKKIIVDIPKKSDFLTVLLEVQKYKVQIINGNNDDDLCNNLWYFLNSLPQKTIHNLLCLSSNKILLIYEL